MRIARHALALVFALGLGACAGRMHVDAVVSLPPELPLRAFPEIIVMIDGLRDEHDIAEGVAAHLTASATGSRVLRLDEDQLHALRERGQLGPAAVILRVRTRVIESTRPSWIVRPETVCGPWGCRTEQRRLLIDIPVIEAIALLRVHEGRTGRMLQELPLRERDDGNDPLGMRLRAMMRLRARAIAALDPGQVRVSIELEPVDDDAVRAALEAIRTGHPAEARQALERIATHDGFESRAVDDRARILFDLGQARRLEARAAHALTEAEREARLVEAERSIRGAIHLRPREVYARALAQIAEERQARERMRALEEAASHNFALAAGTGGEAVPAPPPSYEGATAP